MLKKVQFSSKDSKIEVFSGEDWSLYGAIRVTSMANSPQKLLTKKTTKERDRIN